MPSCRPTVAQAHHAILELATELQLARRDLAATKLRVARLEVANAIGNIWPHEYTNLAVASPVLLELLTQGHRWPNTSVRPHYSLSRLWRIAGAPSQLDPREVFEPGYQRLPNPAILYGVDFGGLIIGNVVDRAGRGVFACWETAVKYAQWLDPANIEPDHAEDLANW